jgi:hypothetical protein
MVSFLLESDFAGCETAYHATTLKVDPEMAGLEGEFRFRAPCRTRDAEMTRAGTGTMRRRELERLGRCWPAWPVRVGPSKTTQF